MSQTLYRKYRPKKFADVIGQEHVVQTLENAIATNRSAHAYLFTGPRGTGKTTLARIFAVALNCTKRKGFTQPPKDVCERLQNGTSLDVIEIDAASHTGVDNIRELRETVVLPPTEAVFKVYIIDEVHMLSTGAFNALLKTLEEPPTHAVFVLATTEIHKVPQTIQSRTQRFDFARLSLDHIAQKITTIAKSEKVSIDKDAVAMIAIAAEGGMRDAESLLAQVIALEDKNITAAEVAAIFGTAEHAKVRAMINALCVKDTSAGLTLVNELADQGYDLSIFAKSLITGLRHALFLSIHKDLSDTLSLNLTKDEQQELLVMVQQTTTDYITRCIEQCTHALTEIARSPIPQLPLEIAIVKLTYDGDAVQETPQDDAPQKKESSHTPKKSMGDETLLHTVKDQWHNAITKVKEQNNSLAGLLKNVEPLRVHHDTLTISVRYPFHKEKIMESENKLTVEKVLDTICETRLNIDVVVDPSTTPKEEDASTSTLLSRATTLMGGAVVEN